MDAKELRDKALVGRKVWVQGTLLTCTLDNVFGNITVGFVTPTGGESVETKVFLHSSSIVKLAPRELRVGDIVRWTAEESGGLNMRGELLWFNDKHVLVQWNGYTEPEISERDAVELVEGTT